MQRGLTVALRVKAGYLSPPTPDGFQGWPAPTGRAYMDSMGIIGETLEQRPGAPGGPAHGGTGAGMTGEPLAAPDPMLGTLEDASEVMVGERGGAAD